MSGGVGRYKQASMRVSRMFAVKREGGRNLITREKVCPRPPAPRIPGKPRQSLLIPTDASAVMGAVRLRLRTDFGEILSSTGQRRIAAPASESHRNGKRTFWPARLSRWQAANHRTPFGVTSAWQGGHPTPRVAAVDGRWRPRHSHPRAISVHHNSGSHPAVPWWRETLAGLPQLWWTPEDPLRCQPGPRLPGLCRSTISVPSDEPSSQGDREGRPDPGAAGLGRGGAEILGCSP
jgi:hypothetical protein